MALKPDHRSCQPTPRRWPVAWAIVGAPDPGRGEAASKPAAAVPARFGKGTSSKPLQAPAAPSHLEQIGLLTAGWRCPLLEAWRQQFGLGVARILTSRQMSSGSRPRRWSPRAPRMPVSSNPETSLPGICSAAPAPVPACAIPPPARAVGRGELPGGQGQLEAPPALGPPRRHAQAGAHQSRGSISRLRLSPKAVEEAKVLSAGRPPSRWSGARPG